jgi:hypothetical protein
LPEEEQALVKLIKKEKGLQLVQKEFLPMELLCLLINNKKDTVNKRQRAPIHSVANKSEDHVMVQRNSLQAKGGTVK